jgi:ectoine hydroxylase-related dioxygenase (phytanoyl-CoA dioxygenase family)
MMPALERPGLLTEEQERAFFGAGFAVVRDMFAADEIGELSRAFDRLALRATERGETRVEGGAQFVVSGERIHRIVWASALDPILDRVGRDARLVQAASRLLRTREVVQIVSQAHFKMPGDGVEFPWHQDSRHRRFGSIDWRDVTGDGSYVQTVLAIDDVDETNGPLEFLPGSWRLGHVDRAGGGERAARELLGAVDPVAVPMRAGDVVLFGPYALHRSAPNTSSRPRRAFLNGFAAPGANFRLYPGRAAGRVLAARDGFSFARPVLTRGSGRSRFA